MVFKMAKGFERMLRQLKANDRSAALEQTSPCRDQMTPWNNPGYQQQVPCGTGYRHAPNEQGLTHAVGQSTTGQLGSSVYDPTVAGAQNLGVSPETTGSRMSYANWGFQDDDFWQVGMGWDLLDPSGTGPASTDFNFAGTTWF